VAPPSRVLAEETPRVPRAPTLPPDDASSAPAPEPATRPVVLQAPPATAPSLARTAARRDGSRPTVRSAARAPSPAAPVVAPDAAADDPLAREVAALERVRVVLAATPASALRRLAAFDREFPQPTLAEQRDWLGVAALQRLGRTTEARQQAAQALARAPHGLYARQLQRILTTAN
jgi:hypothetical protein